MALTYDGLLIGGWKTTNVSTVGSGYVIEVEIPKLRCQECGCTKGHHRHGLRSLGIVDAPMHGRPVKLRILRSRFKCGQCGTLQVQAVHGISKSTRMTRRCVRYIRKVSFNETTAKTARDVGVDETTVRKISDELFIALERKSKAFRNPIRYIGIDDVKVGGETRIVVTDLERRIPLELLEVNSEESLGKFLDELPYPKSIEVVCTDMASHFIKTVHSHLPKATIVFDRWHLTEFGRDGVSNVRKKIQNELLRGMRYYDHKPTQSQRKIRNVVKRLKRLAIYLRRRRSDTGVKAAVHEHMAKWFATFPVLGEVYDLKEQYMNILESKDAHTAQERMRQWMEDVGHYRIYFKRAVRAITVHEDLVLRAITFPDISNGFTEAQNGSLKTISRMGRGYSFERLRARFLYRDLYKPSESKKKQRGLKAALAQRRKHVQLAADAGFAPANQFFIGPNFISMKCKSCGKNKPIPSIAEFSRKSAYGTSPSGFPELTGICATCRDPIITKWTKDYKTRDVFVNKSPSMERCSELIKSIDDMDRLERERRNKKKELKATKDLKKYAQYIIDKKPEKYVQLAMAV